MKKNVISGEMIKETETNFYNINNLILQLKSSGNVSQYEESKGRENIGNDCFPCDQCNYIAKQMGHLKRHKQAKHQMLKIPCDVCDKQFSYKDQMKRHMNSVHNRCMHKCDNCDFETTRKDALIIHNIRKHQTHLQKRLDKHYQIKHL